LRWYAPAGLSAAADWLSGVLVKATVRESALCELYAPSAYFVVLLEAFVTMLFACAVAAEYLGSIFERLQGQVSAARAETARSQALWSALLEQLPLPAVLLDANTHEVMCVSAPAMAKFFGGEESIVGRDFFQAIHFSYPEAVQQLINGAGGVERLSMVRLGDQLLATEVRVQHLAQRGRRFALSSSMTRRRLSAGAALDVASMPPWSRILRARPGVQQAARALFPGRSRAEVSRLLRNSTRDALVGSGAERPSQDARDGHAACIPAHHFVGAAAGGGCEAVRHRIPAGGAGGRGGPTPVGSTTVVERP